MRLCHVGERTGWVVPGLCHKEWVTLPLPACVLVCTVKGEGGGGMGCAWNRQFLEVSSRTDNWDFSICMPKGRRIDAFWKWKANSKVSPRTVRQRLKSPGCLSPPTPPPPWGWEAGNQTQQQDIHEACLSGSWGTARQKGRVAIGERRLEPNIGLPCLWPRLAIAVDGQTGEAWHRARAVTVWASEPREPPRSAVSPEWRAANLLYLSCQLPPSHSKAYRVPKTACVAHIRSCDWSWGREGPWHMGLASSQTWQGFFFFFNLSWTMHPFGAGELLFRTMSLNA